jgi:hypothetical protein
MVDPLTTGLVGIGLMIAQWYHNHKIREYEERQALALEKVAGVLPPERHRMVSWVWPKPIRRNGE